MNITLKSIYINLTICLLFVAYKSTTQWSEIPKPNTYILWCVFALIIYYVFSLRDKSNNIWPIKLFITYIFIMALYGLLFQASYYWDYKMLVGNILSFSLCVLGLVFCQSQYFILMMKGWMKYGFILILILIPFTGSDGIGRMMMPFIVMALFWKKIKLRFKIILIITYIFTLTFGIDNRSDIIKYSFALALGILISIPIVSKMVNWLYKYIVIGLLTAPLIFFVLGLSNVFNVFEIDKEFGWYGKYTTTSSIGEETNLVSDTRTFLYIEEISSAINNDYVIFGRSPARGYDSVAFAEADMVKYRSERSSCEVNILNIFNYFGLVGVILFFVIFLFSALYVFKNSNNTYVRIILIMLSFMWFYSWVHNTIEFNTTTFMTFVMVGVCCSKEMNNITDNEFEKTIRYIQN